MRREYLCGRASFAAEAYDLARLHHGTLLGATSGTQIKILTSLAADRLQALEVSGPGACSFATKTAEFTQPHELPRPGGSPPSAFGRILPRPQPDAIA